ncbi:MAG: stage II sporulation protein M [Planctomycetota bacterium]
MDLDRFISQRQGAWRRLEATLQQIERSGLDTLTVARLRELGALYRQSCSDLIYARTVLQNDELGDFLNKLVGDAYAAIYRRSWLTPGAAWTWFARGLPATVRRSWGPVLAAWILLLGGTAAGFFGTLRDKEAFYYIVPSEYHHVYAKKADDPREARFGNSVTIAKSRDFAAMLFTHNIKVSLTAFALGTSGGTLTSVMMAYNGALLGSIAANYHRWDQDLEFWGLIVPHAGLELSSIALAGAGGLMLGWGLIRPGRKTRGEAFSDAGKEAVSLALGAAPFLVIAGFIEAFVTPSDAIGPTAKVILGVMTGAGMWIHLLLPRRTAA